MDVETMDDATTSLILQMQINDAQDLAAARSARGKSREREISDLDFALTLQLKDWESYASILTSRRMARSMARACQSDSDVLTFLRGQEHQDVLDRALACRLGGIATTEISDESLAQLAALNVTQASRESASNIVAIVPPPNLSNAEATETTCSDTSSEVEDLAPESSSWAMMRAKPKNANRQCTVCFDKTLSTEAARLQCGHDICRFCVEELFSRVVIDESMFPPHCCQPIEPADVKPFLTAALEHQYEEKRIEYNTPEQKRAYCHACSLFIRLEHITNDKAECLSCKAFTCTICQKAVHDGDCPKDIELQKVVEMGKQNLWMRCFACRRMIELGIGCYHISCPCGAGFCYVCGKKWKTCECPLFEERHLLPAGNRIDGEPAQADAEIAPAVQRRAISVVRLCQVSFSYAASAWPINAATAAALNRRILKESEACEIRI